MKLYYRERWTTKEEECDEKTEIPSSSIFNHRDDSDFLLAIKIASEIPSSPYG